ncbi:MAG: DUF2505 domain-containing protein [Hahellaceae bacterium]|nr:DUF2505 domain-containing protein [Hahellaceae bacterium]
MKVQVEQRFSQPIDKVFAAFGDRARLEEKLRFLGSRNVQIKSFESSPSHIVAHIVREVPAEAPAMLKKFIAEWNTTEQKEEWKGSPEAGYSGTFSVNLVGIPVTISGRFSLKAAGNETLQLVELEADSRVPLVGKKLAEFTAGKSKEALLAEMAFWADNLKK